MAKMTRVGLAAANNNNECACNQVLDYYSFDSIVTNVGVKNVITNYVPIEVNESILLWRSNIILLIVIMTSSI